MTTGHARRVGRAVVLAAAFAGLVLGLVAAAAPSRAASAQPKGAPKPPAGQKLELVGASVCQKCHQEKEPEKFDAMVTFQSQLK